MFLYKPWFCTISLIVCQNIHFTAIYFYFFIFVICRLWTLITFFILYINHKFSFHYAVSWNKKLKMINSLFIFIKIHMKSCLLISINLFQVYRSYGRFVFYYFFNHWNIFYIFLMYVKYKMFVFIVTFFFRLKIAGNGFSPQFLG